MSYFKARQCFSPFPQAVLIPPNRARFPNHLSGRRFRAAKPGKYYAEALHQREPSKNYWVVVIPLL
ncbi:MAG: hypothetical protein KAW61_03235, partial [candidate division Zixibacteria bacterium]|nr:hypothetical protein [candidate division Zixibacteria bacterium]